MKRATSNWKKEYSTSYLRSKGAKLYTIISTDELQWFGAILCRIFTNNIRKSIKATAYDLSKIKIIDESGEQQLWHDIQERERG